MMRKRKHRSTYRWTAVLLILAMLLAAVPPAAGAEESEAAVSDISDPPVQESVPTPEAPEESAAAEPQAEETAGYTEQTDTDTASDAGPVETPGPGEAEYTKAAETLPTGGAQDAQTDPEAQVADPSEPDDAENQGEEPLPSITEEELVSVQDDDAATDRAKNDYGISLHPKGAAPSTLRSDDVSGSVAEAGYFPSKRAILRDDIPGVFSASMITWHRDRGAACYRIMDTTIFAAVFGGTAAYLPQAGDLIFYQSYRSEYNRGIITSGNANWLHVGIVSEVGDDYIATIEGNTWQRVFQRTFYTYRYNDGLQDFTKSWIVNVFGEDDDARRAFLDTARAALREAETDAWYGRSGLNSWCESCYEGVYQDDTIASGYFQVPAAWCEMFVLWCAFHADIQYTGAINLMLCSENSKILPTIISNYPTMNNYIFELFACSDDGRYDTVEPIDTQVTDITGTAVFSELPWGKYHIQATSYGAYGPVAERQLNVVLNEKNVSVPLRLGFSESAFLDDCRWMNLGWPSEMSNNLMRAQSFDREGLTELLSR